MPCDQNILQVSMRLYPLDHTIDNDFNFRSGAHWCPLVIIIFIIIKSCNLELLEKLFIGRFVNVELKREVIQL